MWILTNLWRRKIDHFMQDINKVLKNKLWIISVDLVSGIVIMITNYCRSFFSTRSKYINQFFELTKFKLSVLNGIVTIGAFSMYPAVGSCLPLLASSVALSMSTQALNQFIEI